MMHPERYRERVGGSDLWAIIAAVVIAILMIVFATQVHAQISNAKHNLADGTGGASPPDVLTIDHTDPMR
jgi:hypothetical protein